MSSTNPEPSKNPESHNARQGFDGWGAWDTNPLYALLHEAIYCQGHNSRSGWAAQRVRDAEYSADFDAALAVANGAPVMFTGARPVAAAQELQGGVGERRRE